MLFTPDLWVPLVNLHGVYILPGIPRLFKSMVDMHKDRFKGPANKSRTLYTNTVEGDLAGESHRAMCQKQATQGCVYANHKHVLLVITCELRPCC